MGWNRSTRGLDRLKRPTLRKKKQNPVPLHVIGSHPVIFVDAREPEDAAVEGGSPVKIGDIEGCFKNSIELRHPRSPITPVVNIPQQDRGKPQSRSCNPVLTQLVFLWSRRSVTSPGEIRREFMLNRSKDAALLIGRVLIAALFLPSG
jgi:hypothetical protein